MIQEHHEAIPEDYKVSAPTVAPWARFPRCTKCDYCLGAGVWLWGLWRLARGDSAQHYAYCPGDKNSTAQGLGLNLQTGEMVPMDRRVPCFGVFHEHIHCDCGRCGFAWLMACKGGTQ